MGNRVKNYMLKAYKEGVLIPAFNAAYPEMVKSICDTLKRLNTFGMVEVARPDIEKFGAKSFKVIYSEYKKYADPEYISLHQDHVPVVDEDKKKVDYISLLKEALDLGFDSVMVDGSRLSINDNIIAVKEVVKMAHKKGIPVEAELGAVLGHEKGPIPPYEELFKSGKGFTNPDDAKRFVEETNVDWFSVAIGNIHGAISGAAKDQEKVKARLDIEHLKKIKNVTGVPLVLHGGSGVKREYVLEAIKNGLAKINIGTDIRQAYEKVLNATGDIKKAQNEVSKVIEYLVVDYYKIKGSLERLR